MADGHEGGDEYTPSSRGADYLVNAQLKDFVFDLHDATRRSHLEEDVRRLYEVEFKELSDKYCDKQPWPSAEAIESQCVGEDGRPDAFFLAVYTELAFRHAFAKLKPTVEDRLAAWDNYCRLFAYLLRMPQEDVGDLTLTSQWVFDVLHEFVYQFQSFCQFRTAPQNRSRDELRVLAATARGRTAWEASKALSMLFDLAALLPQTNEASSSGKNFALRRDLGYFALCARSRLECLLGDHAAAVSVLDAIDPFDEAGVIASVFSCRLNVSYHLGVALLMLGRYVDSARALDSVVGPLARTHRTHGGFQARALPPGAPPPEQVQKTFDRMLALLAVAQHLAGGSSFALSGSGKSSHRDRRYRIDDASAAALKDKFLEKLSSLDQQKNNNDGAKHALHHLLTSACPKFIVPSRPDYARMERLDGESEGVQANAAAASSQQQDDAAASAADLPDAAIPKKHPGQQGQLLDAYNQQIRLFDERVAIELKLARIRSYLKLYASIGLDKLARFNDCDRRAFRALLVGLKSNMLVPKPRPSDPPTGVPTTTTSETLGVTTSTTTVDDDDDVEDDDAAAAAAAKTSRTDRGQDRDYATAPDDLHFFVSGNMIYVDEPRGANDARHELFFMDQIFKYQQATHALLAKGSVFASLGAAFADARAASLGGGGGGGAAGASSSSSAVH